MGKPGMLCGDFTKNIEPNFTRVAKNKMTLKKIAMMKVNDIRSKRLRLVFEEQEKAAKFASTATGFIMSICFFVLPVVWSSMFHLLPIAPPACQQSHPQDPWNEFTTL